MTIILTTSVGSEKLINVLGILEGLNRSEVEVLIIEKPIENSVILSNAGNGTKSNFPFIVNQKLQTQSISNQLSMPVKVIDSSFSDMLKKAIKQSRYDILLFLDDSTYMNEKTFSYIEAWYKEGEGTV